MTTVKTTTRTAKKSMTFSSSQVTQAKAKRPVSMVAVHSGVYLMASSIRWSRLVRVTSLNSSKHSSLVGASTPMLP